MGVTARGPASAPSPTRSLAGGTWRWGPRAATRCLVVLLALLSVGPAFAQPDPVDDVVRPVLDTGAGILVPAAENETGEDLHTEEIALDIFLDVRNAEAQVVNVLFGGGKVQADAHADLVLEFRAVGMERLDAAVQAATGDANASVSNTFGVPAERLALTAEEVRLVGAGALLEYFQGNQEQLAAGLIEATVPGMRVLDASFTWQHTEPLADARGRLPRPGGEPDLEALAGLAGVPPLRDPPLVLEASFDIQYLDRFSAVSIVRGLTSGEDEAGPDLKEQIRENETGGFLDRSAFEVLGVGQLLSFKVPPGWRVHMEVTVPDGFTVEGVTDELVLGEAHRSMAYTLDGSDRKTAADQAGIVTVSSRFTVTALALGLTALAGVIVRIPTETAVIQVAYWRQRRRGGTKHRPRLRARAAAAWQRWRTGWSAFAAFWLRLGRRVARR